MLHGDETQERKNYKIYIYKQLHFSVKFNVSVKNEKRIVNNIKDILLRA